MYFNYSREKPMGKYSNLQQCYLIAEIGVNHNGDMNLAKKMIDEAVKSGADAVKFQTFKAINLVTKGTPKVKYQEKTTSRSESHYEMIEKLELKESQHYVLKNYCEKCGIDFISTPYDISSVEFLESLGVEQYKIASADLVDFELLKAIASTRKPVILSLGMASLGEIEDALNLFSNYDKGDLLLLHCVSNYPCSDNSLNLRVIEKLKKTFDYELGFSDHSIGFLAAVISISLGAKVIEKHFTLDKKLDGPDHKASSTPKEFFDLKNAVRRAELMLGSGDKKCQLEEMEMSKVSRKSIVTKKNMKKGDLIQSNDLVMMRPGTGLRAKVIEELIGMKLRKDLPKHTLLNWTDLEASD
jgi:N,N'-diacetyllegionaminate synthase